MIRIAICDDDRILCSTMENYAHKYCDNNKIDVEIQIFHSGEHIVEYIKSQGRFDFIILDIELKALSGIEVGKWIREELRDDITQILYISSCQSYAMQLFANRPINFLVKPIKEEKFEIELGKAIKLISNASEAFEFQSDRTFYKIPYKEIVYFESDDKKIYLHTVYGKYEFYGKLTSVIESVPTEEFFFIHKSYLVNYLHIKKSDYETITVLNDIKLPISQSNRKAIRAKFNMRRKDK